MTSLVCAQCGGPLPEAAARSVVACPFCKVVSKPAPEVVERVVERVVVATPVDAPGGLRCPRCADALRTITVQTATLAGCGHCGGIWLDTKTVDHLRTTRDTDVQEAARRLVAIIQRVDRAPLLSCPVCKTAMQRTEAPGTVLNWQRGASGPLCARFDANTCTISPRSNVCDPMGGGAAT